MGNMQKVQMEMNNLIFKIGCCYCEVNTKINKWKRTCCIKISLGKRIKLFFEEIFSIKIAPSTIVFNTIKCDACNLAIRKKITMLI